MPATVHSPSAGGGSLDRDDRHVQLHKKTEADVRSRIVKIAMRYHKYRARIAYSQSRPTDLRWPRFVRRLDCSGLVAACMHHAKVMPAVDWRWTNTWVQIKLGRPVTLKQAKPGDVVFYGTSASNPTHEALYIGGGQVLSNGHYPMGIYPVDYRSDRVAIRSFIGPGVRA
jgi:cell wall-associated NlpC family hydrolase